MKKIWVLLLIMLCAVFLGFEAVAKVIGMTTYYVGYILGILSFAAAVVLGAKNPPQ